MHRPVEVAAKVRVFSKNKGSNTLVPSKIKLEKGQLIIITGEAVLMLHNKKEKLATPFKLHEEDFYVLKCELELTLLSSPKLTLVSSKGKRTVKSKSGSKKTLTAVKKVPRAVNDPPPKRKRIYLAVNNG